MTAHNSCLFCANAILFFTSFHFDSSKVMMTIRTLSPTSKKTNKLVHESKIWFCHIQCSLREHLFGSSSNVRCGLCGLLRAPGISIWPRVRREKLSWLLLSRSQTTKQNITFNYEQDQNNCPECLRLMRLADGLRLTGCKSSIERRMPPISFTKLLKIKY